MIKRLIEKKSCEKKTKTLKEQLNEIREKFKLAKTKRTFALMEEAMIDVYAELFAFEMDNKNKPGYTSHIKNAVYRLFYKIDYIRVKYMAYDPTDINPHFSEKQASL